MMKLIVPALLAIVGTAGGVGAGILLIKPEPDPLANPCGEIGAPLAEATEHAAEDHAEPVVAGREYVRLDNQFVVPVMVEGQVNALVVLSLSVEVEAGGSDAIFPIEPRLRDVFLQVLFDHANTGGFEGIFTATANMRMLRHALFNAADQALPGMITDVLIVDVVRQDN